MTLAGKSMEVSAELLNALAPMVARVEAVSSEPNVIAVSAEALANTRSPIVVTLAGIFISASPEELNAPVPIDSRVDPVSFEPMSKEIAAKSAVCSNA